MEQLKIPKFKGPGPSPLTQFFKLDNELSYFVIDDLIDNQKSTGDEYSEKDPTGAKKSVEKRCLQRALRRPRDSVCTDVKKYEYCGEKTDKFSMFFNCGGNEKYPDKIAFFQKKIVDAYEGYFLEGDDFNLKDFGLLEPYPGGPLTELFIDPVKFIQFTETYNGSTHMEILLTFTHDCIRKYDKARESLSRATGARRLKTFIVQRFNLIRRAFFSMSPKYVNYQNSVTGNTLLLFFLKQYINCFHRDVVGSNEIPRGDPMYIDKIRYEMINDYVRSFIKRKHFFVEVIDIFIEKGADLGIKNKDGLNVLDFVESYTENEDFDKFKDFLDKSSLSLPLKYYKMGKNAVTMA